MGTEKPIYDQILDLEAIVLHKLATLIESKGGQILDLNTDCASCIFNNDIFPCGLDGNNIYRNLPCILVIFITKAKLDPILNILVDNAGIFIGV